MRKVILLLAFLVFSWSLVLAQQNKIKIVVASFSAEEQDVANKVVNSLTLTLSKYEMFEVVSPALIDTSDIVISGEVVHLKVDKKVGQIKLKLKAQDKAGELISRMEITGTSSAKLDYKGKEKNLIDEAILDAANLVRENLLISLTRTGIVKYIKPDKTISITLGEIDNLRKGAEIIVIREDKKIALYEIFEVEERGSTARVVEKISSTEVAPQDKVKIIFNPQEIKKKKEKGKHKLKPWQTAMAVVTLGAIIYFSNDKGEKPLPPSPPSTAKPVVIILTLSPSVIPADNITTSTITATVKDADTNVAVSDGTMVEFKTDKGMITNITPTSKGCASATLVSDTIPGVVTITATCSGAAASTQINFSPYKMVVNASPVNILADGETSSMITAVIRNASTGNPEIGVTVNFSTNLGVITASSITDSNGIATATLKSGITPGTARIIVSVGPTVDIIEVNFSTPTLASIIVFANPSIIPADGASTAKIIAIIKDPITNHAVPDGTPVEFRSTRGMITGVTTTSTGKATAYLTSDMSPGEAFVTATHGRNSATVRISFTIFNIKLTASPSSIVANGASVSTITATVLDHANNVVPDGTAVSFSTTQGVIGGSGITLNGQATTTLTSAASIEKITATVTAISGGASAAITVDFVPALPGIISLWADPGSIPADGRTTSTITTVVKDLQNNYVFDGTRVNFTSNIGTITSSTTTISGTAVADFYCSNSGTATITVTSGSIKGSVKVICTTLRINLSINPDSIPADGITASTITAKVTDANSGEAKSGVAVNFTTSNGTITASAATNVNGEANATLTSSISSGFARITAAESGGASNIMHVTFTPFGVSKIALSASPTSIIADGVSTSIITAEVKDLNENPVVDETEIKFYCSDDSAKITPSSKTVNGIATATLTSSINAHQVTIVASSGTLSSTYQQVIESIKRGDVFVYSSTKVTFNAGMPAYIRVAVEVGKENIRGWDFFGNTAVIPAYVYDSNHNPVSDGTEITFTTDGGMITENATTSGGCATTTFTTTGGFPVGAANSDTIGYCCGFDSDCDRTDTDGDRFIAHKGWATITARAGSAKGENVILNSGEPYYLKLSAVPSTISIKGGAAILTDVRDINRNAVVPVYKVCYTASLGTVTHLEMDDKGCVPIKGNICSAGVTPSFINDGRAGTSVVVGCVEPGGLCSSTTITVTPGPPRTIVMNAFPPSITADGTSTTTIYAYVMDEGGNYVSDGAVIYFSSDWGTVSPSSATTSGGLATTTLKSDIVAVTCKVTATSHIATGTLDVPFTAGPPTSVVVKASPLSITADGVATSTITVFLYDVNKNPAKDGLRVLFETTIGTIDAFSLTENGAAKATLTSSTSLGAAQVTATHKTLTGTANVIFIPAAPARIVLSAIPSSVGINETSTITAIVYDANGNPVADGTQVTFETTSGSINSPAYTSGGIATTTLSRGAAPAGAVTVKATAGTVTASATVNFP